MRNLAILVVAGVLTSCVSSNMMRVSEPAAFSSPKSDEATVVFMRPSIFGGAIQSSVFDVTDGHTNFLGIVSAGTKFAHVSAPGMRRFMVIGESADFMDADLLAGKTYYALVRVRMGIWKARFSLVPVPAISSDLASYLEDTEWVENTPSASAWANENMSSIRHKQEVYLPQWQARADRPFLQAEDGR